MSFPRVLDQLVVPFLLLFILVGSLGGFALGCGLLLRSVATVGFIHRMNRWVSTRRATRDLELPRQGFLPSKWLGAFLAVGGAFVAYYLIARVQVPRTALSLANPRFGVALAVESIKWLLVAGCLASVLVGVLALFFPATLGVVQARMNRWVSTRTLVPADSERMHTPLDLLVETHPRAAGWMISATSLLVAAAMLVLLYARWLR